MKNRKHYLFEFLSVLFAVLGAFMLNNWNENRKNRSSEIHILEEIRTGIQSDLKDMNENIMGHEWGKESVDYFLNIINNKPVDEKQLYMRYHTLCSDFLSLQNTAGYENLKAKGFEIIRDDKLRTKIIQLYEYSYSMIRSVEENYYPTQFTQRFGSDVDNLLLPNLIFDDSLKLMGIHKPLFLTENEKKRFVQILYALKNGRTFSLIFYKKPMKQAEDLLEMIDSYLDKIK